MALKTQSTGLEEFRSLSRQLTTLFEALRIPRFSPPTDIDKAFESLSRLSADRLLSALNLYVDVAEMANRSQWTALSDSRLIWYALRKLNLRPPSSLFGKIGDDDCVEIYDSEGIQVFRNFTFCKYISYSLEELLIYPWQDLYSRAESTLSEMNAAAGRAFLAEKEPFLPDINPHTVDELKSRELRKISVNFKLVSPLFSPTKETVAFLATSSLKVDSHS